MTTEQTQKAPRREKYDKRKLSYATTFKNPFKSRTIRSMEWMTGKLSLLRIVRRFEAMGPAYGQEFWKQALGLMDIDVRTPWEQIKNIPKTGPVIVVANHPHGLVDGMVLAELIGKIRTDYKILTRSLLTSVDEIKQFMIPVPFPHEPQARQLGLQMRKDALAHLGQGGVIAVFPSGAVAHSERMFGPAIEGMWNPFTAKLIEKSKATVVPICFLGQNSRAYQIAHHLSATIRQGLLIHEVVKSCGKPQSPKIGAPITQEMIGKLDLKPSDFMLWLREQTLLLGKLPTQLPKATDDF